MTRGIITLVWGEKSNLPVDRLLASTKKYHPELPHHVIELNPQATGLSALHEKAKMFAVSPFDETLYLDSDTVVMGKLDFGFEKAKLHGLAVCICECPWARRYKNIFSGDEVEYNTGVIFFTKSSASVFDVWLQNCRTLDASLLHLVDGVPTVMPVNDQGTFAAAIEGTRTNPYVLPFNWNFRPTWNRSFFGPIKIWHDYSDPLSDIEKLNAYYASRSHVIQYHQTISTK